MDFQYSEEQLALYHSARRLALDKFAEKAFTWHSFAWENARILADAGFAGLTIPVEDGGQGAALMDAVIVMEAISSVCPHAADALQATNFGAIRQFAALGSPELKAALMPKFLGGEALVTVGMSEADAGSALTDLRTTARYEGDEVVLNGEKLWNSYGPDATHVVMWCRFGEGTKNIGAVLVPTDAPGFTKGAVDRYMSGEHTCALVMEDCRAPRDHVLADEGALRKLMTLFGIERMGNATRALALAESAFHRAVAHAKTREAFGKELCEFQGLQWQFAEMRTKLDAARLLLYRAVTNADLGAPDPAEAAIAKFYANSIAFEVANGSLQVFGAMGYTDGHPVEYIARRVRGWMIAGGSLEMMKNRIAESVFDRRFNQRA